MTGPTTSLVSDVLAHLLWASLATAAMVAVAWMVCRLRPSLAPATRSTIWWLVAVAALVRLAPLPAVTIDVPSTWGVAAVLPARGGAATASAADGAVAAGPGPAAPGTESQRPFIVPLEPSPIAAIEAAAQPVAPMAPGPVRPITSHAPLDWRTALAMAWASGALLLLLRLGASTRRLRRLARDATPAPPDVAADADRLAAALGLAVTPPVRVSAAIDTPQVFGLTRPIILLPAATLPALTARERAMTLCHELAHVRRRDLTLAWAPALMERLLFFHPGARLAAREYAFAREAACDADVLQHLGAAPRDYGRLLLRLGVTRRPAALAAAQSSPSTRLLRRRLAMLNDHGSAPRPGRGFLLAGVLLLPLAVPLSLTAARQSDPPLPPAPPTAAPAVPPPPASPRSAVDIGPAPPRASARDAGQDPAPPPAPPRQPAPPAAAIPPPPPPPPGVSARNLSMWVGDDDGRHGWVLLDGDGDTVFSGSWRDAETARRLRGDSKGPFLYFRSEGKAYIVRDPAVIERVRKEMKEQQELGQEQAALGAEQAALGARQGELGARQGEFGVREHEAIARMAVDGASRGQLRALEQALGALEARSDQRGPEVEAALEAVRAAIDALRRTVKVENETAADADALRAHAEAVRAGAMQQREFGAKQAELGRLQAELGQKQAALGRQQRAAADAARQRILKLLEEAAAHGQAQPVK